MDTVWISNTRWGQKPEWCAPLSVTLDDAESLLCVSNFSRTMFLYYINYSDHKRWNLSGSILQSVLMLVPFDHNPHPKPMWGGACFRRQPAVCIFWDPYERPYLFTELYQLQHNNPSREEAFYPKFLGPNLRPYGVMYTATKFCMVKTACVVTYYMVHHIL